MVVVEEERVDIFFIGTTMMCMYKKSSGVEQHSAYTNERIDGVDEDPVHSSSQIYLHSQSTSCQLRQKLIRTIKTKIAHDVGP